jgi:cation:H+ antiporter
VILWLQFAACTVLIVYCGSNLSRYGDVIAEKSGLGRTWTGVILLASVTSLPELVTGISSVALYDLPDIAVGDVLGSCMFNILIIGLLDLVGGAAPISTRAHQGQILTAAFGILLLGLVAINLSAGKHAPAIGWVGAYSLVFLAVYFLAMRVVFLYEKGRLTEFMKELAEEARYGHISSSRAYTLYAANAAVIVLAAAYLPKLAAQIAEVTGLGQAFVGNALVAASTSLPEVVVSVAALRIGAVDMVYGNIFGSNLFNILILAVDDLFYAKGPLLSHVSPDHVVPATAAMALSAVAVIGLTYRAGRKVLPLAWDALGIVSVYLFAMGVLYVTR